MTPAQIQALRKIVEYLWDAEERDYEGTDDPYGHIFVSVRILGDMLDAMDVQASAE
jgi:hypothetical protein